MGQKVNPISIRVGITRTWNSNWFVANKNTYKAFLHEDLKIRTFIKKNFFQSGISKIEIERSSIEKIRIKDNEFYIFNLNEKKRTFFIEVPSELVFHNISKL